MESPLDVLSRAASMVNQTERLEVNGRIKVNTSQESGAKIQERAAASRSENKRHFSDHPMINDLAAIIPTVPCFPADRCRENAVAAAAAAAAAAAVGQWQSRHLLSMHADLGDLQGPAGLPPYAAAYRGDGPGLGWMALFDKRLVLPPGSVAAPKMDSVGLAAAAAAAASELPPPRSTDFGQAPAAAHDQEPLNLSRKPSTASEAALAARGQPSSASVFTSVSAMAVSDKNQGTAASKQWRDMPAESCDPAIEEHFRRSLGSNYMAPPSGRAHVADAVDDHFAKSLGSTWQKVNSPVGNEGGKRPRAAAAAVTAAVHAAPRSALTVDDHFSKALGDKWLELQRAGSEPQPTSAAAPSANTESEAAASGAATSALPAAKRQKLAAKACS